MCGTNFCTAARKILNSLSLRSRDRGHWPQNLRSKELRGKILTNKYLQFAHAMCVFGSGLTTSGRTVAESWRTFHYALSVLRVKVTCHKKAGILCGRLWRNLDVERDRKSQPLSQKAGTRHQIRPAAWV